MRRLAPERGHGVAFLLGLAGMAVGLGVDARTIFLSGLATLCAADGGLLASALRDWALLPATHVLMLAGGLVLLAGPAGRWWHRIGRCGLCTALMAGGMAAAPWLLRRSGLSWTTPTMLAAMAGGMAAGAALTVQTWGRRPVSAAIRSGPSTSTMPPCCPSAAEPSAPTCALSRSGSRSG